MTIIIDLGQRLWLHWVSTLRKKMLLNQHQYNWRYLIGNLINLVTILVNH